MRLILAFLYFGFNFFSWKNKVNTMIFRINDENINNNDNKNNNSSNNTGIISDDEYFKILRLYRPI